jgi:hypothetical protein
MSSVKSLNNRVTLLERKVNVGDYGGMRVGGGLLQVDVSNSKVNINSSRITIGQSAGANNQGIEAVAIGQNAGQINQGANAVAIGYGAAQYNQGTQATAIGTVSASTGQGVNAVSIGFGSGVVNQGTQAIAIGAYSGVFNQTAGSIVIDASGSAFDSIPGGQRSLFVRPIRNVNNATAANALAYDPSTYEITHNGSKTFVINHPLDDSKYLVHACLEGPEAGVYYRGKDEITNGESVEVTLPEYTKNFYNFTVQVTPINSRIVYGVSEVEDGKFKVLGDNGKFFWTVQATRNEINVEPNKSDVVIKGDGPYTYISN